MKKNYLPGHCRVLLACLTICLFVGMGSAKGAEPSPFLAKRVTEMGVPKKVIRTDTILPPLGQLSLIGPAELCEDSGDSIKVLFSASGQGPFTFRYATAYALYNKGCKTTPSTQTYVAENKSQVLLKFKNPGAGTYTFSLSRVSDTRGEVDSFSTQISFVVHPKPLGTNFSKTQFTCNTVNIDLQALLACDIASTFTWYSVNALGSSTPFNNPNVLGETLAAGSGALINDVLTNTSVANQTIFYRVVPRSQAGCEGEPFYVQVRILPKTKVECLACRTGARVSLGANCRLLITPSMVMEGFSSCDNGELLKTALEVLVKDANGDSYVEKTGEFEYIVRLKDAYKECFTFTPCSGRLSVENHQAPAFVKGDLGPQTVYCFDANFVLNNPKTVGPLGTKPSFPQLVGGSGGITVLHYVRSISDDVQNLGYAHFEACNCDVDVKWFDRLVTYGCDSLSKKGLWGRIERRWVAVSLCNGRTEDTTQVIELRRPPLSEFKFKNPKPALSAYDQIVTYTTCVPDKRWIRKEDWLPSIQSTFFSLGEPKLERKFLLDDVECNFSVQQNDREFTVCEGKGLIIDREIYVVDWCKGGIDTLRVLIRIGDFQAPTLRPKETPITIATGPNACTASLPVSAARLNADHGLNLIDNCNLSNISVRVKTKDRYSKSGVLIAENTWDLVPYVTSSEFMHGLPLGRHRMIITAYDDCFNAMRDSVELLVVDKTAPVMKCKDALQVVLSNTNGYVNGYAKVQVADVNVGSFDNCALKWLKLRRSYNPNCKSIYLTKGYDLNNDKALDEKDGFTLAGERWMTPLEDLAEFFCCDLSEKVSLELWGEDQSGNRSFCALTIAPEDKVAPICSAPSNMRVFCDDKRLGTIDNHALAATSWGNVKITAGHECSKLDTLYQVKKHLTCGAGTIERIWTLSKTTPSGVLSTECVQVITVLPIREYDVLLPRDVELKDCSKPVVDTLQVVQKFCDILAVNVADKRFEPSGSECYKIFRTFTIINWCAYVDRCAEPNAAANVYVIDRKWTKNGQDKIWLMVRDNNRDGNERFVLSYNKLAFEGSLSNGILSDIPIDDEEIVPPFCKQSEEFFHAFMYTQIIKVFDNTAPTISAVRDTFCTDVVSCTANRIRIPFVAKDNCSKNLELERSISLALFQTPIGPYIPQTNRDYGFNTEQGSNGNMSVTLSNLPEGTHDLIVSVRDECGNVSVATRIPFVVQDCKGPAPICLKSFVADMQSNGEGGGAFTLFASDLIASKVFDCNGQGPEKSGALKLVTKYSINRLGEKVAPTQDKLIFNCAQTGKPINLEVHAWDEVGNHDFCICNVLIQDSKKVCPTITLDGEIAGLVLTEDAKALPGVVLVLSGDKQDQARSSLSGAYQFKTLAKNGKYTITPQLDKDPRNGVTTFDLVLVQKHILGIGPLENPYRMIAADVNDSKSISTADLIQMRKVILNLDPSFKGLPSWRFVAAKFKFSDVRNPWAGAFPEQHIVNDLSEKVQADFVAIKLGDVNGSAVISQ
jgi:large repetitive protein